ncbi:hypothetical protein UO65_4424 [Actinokineospora spheciospongiae]|uniref:2-hydroxy-acid oxidase n=1 Tax=Actinokineospora spheciospongiae TaxID=909613 RepID=W7IV95_9PSEU|nr:hypothetical protein [Actinokineospora spheciospongiae]EWC60316.1 hypothetical protein UO65_4424 [Actinokineospora spheciospongiae]
MLTVGPPPAMAAAAPRLSGAVGRVFTGTSPTAWDPALRPFLADLVRPFGTGLREDLLVDGAGHSFGEMAEALLPDLVDDREPVDLLVLAYALHDLRLGRSTATHLSDRCPGRPAAFAVCDQGSAAPFTAVRLIESYFAGGACSRAVLLVVEQSALHYELAAPAPLPDRHTAVGLRFDTDGAPLTVRQRTAVEPAHVAAVLAAEVAALRGDRADTTLIACARLAGLLPPGIAHVVAAEGQPCTGVWYELATGRPEGLVLLAEYTPEVGVLSLSALDVPAPARPLADARAVAG